MRRILLSTRVIVADAVNFNSNMSNFNSTVKTTITICLRFPITNQNLIDITLDITVLLGRLYKRHYINMSNLIYHKPVFEVEKFIYEM